jgi:anti-sigma regulatory factor (Ser/Thr protein kinase)
MSKLASAVSQVCAFAGTPEEIRNVRGFIGRLLGGCPVADAVVLLSSELATNAVLHSASGAGGTFSVSVRLESGQVRVEVHDLGSDTSPTIREPGRLAESGAGLRVVEEIANRWGFYDDPSGRVVWFEMDWQ